MGLAEGRSILAGGKVAGGGIGLGGRLRLAGVRWLDMELGWGDG